MRPNDSQACPVSQSGTCSLIDATSPNVEAMTNHATANPMHNSTGHRPDASWMRRSLASSTVRTENSPVWPVRFIVSCSAFCPATLAAAGSSAKPISLAPKITRLAADSGPNSPFDIDQMKSPSPPSDAKNVTTSKPIVNDMGARESGDSHRGLARDACALQRLNRAPQMCSNGTRIRPPARLLTNLKSPGRSPPTSTRSGYGEAREWHRYRRPRRSA